MGWAGKQRSYGSKPMSGKQRQASVVSLLVGCREEQLRAMSAEALARAWGVPLAWVTDRLAQVKQERGV